MNQSRIKSTMARLVATPEPLSKEEKEAGARLWQDMRIGKELPRNKNGIEKVILLSNKTL
ncbi:MAG: hypothetical protein II118_00830 [Ruminococcus sp.]|jgi:hypothetical protein|nr:hypothetical protein [Ruminococcus sp.]MBQ1308788.1 hypothetical protein [Ruminococcus sp.]MBQ1381554.1 hypothetical protein [Ruminococcus sp.]MBQ1601577.1 hypothetical protein [Ruminococcus sp.]MBQ1638171.1 hypothetical protein [Ruminococcus sp.]